MKHHSHSPSQTESFGAQFAKKLHGGEVVGLIGTLGAGKTCFVKGMATGLGLDPSLVLSPTFTLVNEYEGTPLHLIHVDLYRLEKEVEFADLGLEDYLTPHSVMVIEWADKVPRFWQRNMIKILFEISDEERIIKIV